MSALNSLLPIYIKIKSLDVYQGNFLMSVEYEKDIFTF